MADEEITEPDGTSDEPTEGEEPSGSSATARPGMSEADIRQAGLAIDVPFESGQPEPERLRYADLGKTWTPPEGWPPDQGQPQDEDAVNA